MLLWHVWGLPVCNGAGESGHRGQAAFEASGGHICAPRAAEGPPPVDGAELVGLPPFFSVGVGGVVVDRAWVGVRVAVKTADGE